MTDSSSPLAGTLVVVIGGSQGIGRSTAIKARSRGAQVIITGRDPDRLAAAAAEIGAADSAAFDATDRDALQTFFDDLGRPVDHVMVSAGAPYYAPLAQLDHDRVTASLDAHLFLTLDVARIATTHVAAGGSLSFMSGTGAKHSAPGLTIAGFFSIGLPALIANLALEVAPVRVNLIAAGFVDTPLSARILGNDLEARRAELRATLPVRRVVTADDVGALAVHIMENPALTGATFDIDGGQQLL